MNQSRALTILFAALFLGASAVAVFQYWDVQARDLSLESANQALKDADAKREAMEKRNRELSDELEKVKADLAALNQAPADAKKGRPALAGAAGGPEAVPGSPPETPKSAGGGLMQSMAQMFKTPEGRQMMKSQAAMGTRMAFGNLAKSLNLSKEDGELVMGMLSDRQSALSETAFAAMADGTLDDQEIAALSASNTKTRSEYDAKLKSVLGDQKFQEMKDYERSIGDRMMLTFTQGQFSGSPLGDTQRESLLKIMSDARKSSPEPIFDPTGQDLVRGLSDLQDASAIDRHMAQEAAYQQKVLNAATQTLSPDQINSLQKGFEQTLQWQKMRIEMIKPMVNKGGAPAAPAAK